MSTGYVLDVTVGKEHWMTSNQRKHWSHRALSSKALRRRGVLLARANRLPALARVSIEAVVSTPTNTRFDAANSYPTIKPLIDSLVSAGVLEDASDKYLTALTIKRGVKTGIAGKYRVVLNIYPE